MLLFENKGDDKISRIYSEPPLRKLWMRNLITLKRLLRIGNQSLKVTYLMIQEFLKEKTF